MLVHLLRHLALRLWLTVLIGGLGSLALVPLLQALMGLDWMVLPVLAFLVGVFLAVGWLLNAWAALMIERLQAEGAVWERAGMRREATHRYQALLGLVDSFMLSPGRRRQALAALLPKLTRFYLDHAGSGVKVERLLRAHLESQPGDAEVAARWLRIQVEREDPPPWVHDLAQRIGDALPAAEEIIGLLVRFYLANGRGDRAAVALYRKQWRTVPAFRKTRAVTLAQLLSLEGHADLWALDVYLAAWAQGAPPSKLRPMVQGCLAAADRSGEESPLLARAREMVGSVMPATAFATDEASRLSPSLTSPPPAVEAALADEGHGHAEAFEPAGDLEDEAAFVYRRRRQRRRLAVSAWTARVRREAGGRLLAVGPLLGRLGQGILRQLRRPWGRGLAIGVVAAALALLMANTVLHLRPGAAPPPPSEPAPAPVVTDPFTIQVAAYLKAEDAKAYAAQLKGQGLDAYWTEAVGAKRSWYQVRIDHFATKAAARSFGEDLKAKGLINDFYVANYRPPPPPEKK